jgi:hypothetical protein
MAATVSKVVNAATAVLVAARIVLLGDAAVAKGPKSGDGAIVESSSCAGGGAQFPQPIDLRDIQARGPLDALLRRSYAHLLKGPAGFGSDWDNPNEPGDGRGRWMMAMCNYGAYLHVKPRKMMDEMPRMKTMRNPYGFFGLKLPADVIQAQASFDNSWPVQWGIDYARYFGDPFGLEFARSIADAFYVPRVPFFEPYAERPKGHWMGEFHHQGIGLGGMVGVARLAKVTREDRYVRAARGLADLFLKTKYDWWHGHATSTAVLGLLFTYEATADRRYLDAAVHAVDRVFAAYELPYLGHAGHVAPGIDHSEGCGVSDYLYLHLLLGRLTGEARYFDKAERILWGPFFHHVRPSGGMGVDALDATRTQLKLGGYPDTGYDADMCCSMWAANGLVRAFTHAVLADDARLTVPLYYPFVASAKLPDGKKVKLSMVTAYPNDGAVLVRLLECDEPQAWTLRLRVPAWSTVTSLAVNGHPRQADAEQGWLALKRDWRAGDELALALRLPLWLSRPHSEEVLAIPCAKQDSLLKEVRLFRGPLLLALDKLRNPALDWPREGRWTLLLPASDAMNPANAPIGEGFDRAFVYPAAHLKVSCAMLGGTAAEMQPARRARQAGAAFDASSVKPERIKAAVLTPIAEGPGRLGASPEEVMQKARTDREAVLFDVTFCQECRQTSSGEEPAPGDSFADKPPMGWNTSGSYNLAGENEDMIKRGVDRMVETRLKAAGYRYVLIDYGWYQKESGTTTGANGVDRCDAYGRLVPYRERFPSAARGRGFKPLADYVHAKGMKFGLHVMRGIYRGAYDANLPVEGTTFRAREIADTASVCGWSDLTYGLKMSHPGAQAYLNSLLRLYGAWGVDFLKIDDLICPYHRDEVEGYSKARLRAGRPIMISGSPGDAMPLGSAGHLRANMEMFRVTKDQWDAWSDILVQFEQAPRWAPYCGQGHWADLDALPFGRFFDQVTARRIIDSRLSRDEIRTDMTLHCVARSPLVFYADPMRMDDFTREILTNRDALDADQSGCAQRQFAGDAKVRRWISIKAGTTTRYLALFNLTDKPLAVEQPLAEAGFPDGCEIRDVWERRDLGFRAGTYATSVAGHGVGFYRLDAKGTGR